MSTFHYGRMTPGLRAALDHLGAYDRDDAKLWRAKRRELVGALADGEWAAYWAAERAWRCRDETQAGEPTTYASPSGRYQLVVTSHTTGKATWHYTRGRVYEGERLVATINRNFSAFPFAFVEGHGKTGGDYLLCGEDYLGQTCVDLRTGARVDHLPAEAEEGVGFCWADIRPSPDGTVLAVDGCYWACPYEVIIVDFGDPMSVPWPEFARVESPSDTLPEWSDDGTIELTKRWEEVDLPGHRLHGERYDDTTDEEDAEVAAEAAKRGLGSGEDGAEPGWVEKAHTWRWGLDES